MTDAPPPPLDVAAVVKLAVRGNAWLDEVETLSRHLQPRDLVQLQSADLAVVVAARMAARLGAVGLVSDVRRWADASNIPDEPISIPDVLASALAQAVRAGVSPEQLEPLLSDRADWLVCRAVDALDPERASDLALLERLALDRRAEVATTARRRLGPRHVWQWWAGIFEHDPAVAYAHDPALVAALARARTALGRDRLEGSPGAPSLLLRTTEPLPPALSIPLLEAGLAALLAAWASRTPNGVDDDTGDDDDGDTGDDDDSNTDDDGDTDTDDTIADADDPRIVVTRLHALAGTEGLVRALRRLAAAQGNPEHALGHAAVWCSSLAEPARLALAEQLLPWIDRDGFGEPAAALPGEPTPSDTPATRGVSRLVARLWPRRRFPDPLLAAFLALPSYGRVARYVFKDVIDETKAELGPHLEALQALAFSHPELLDDLSTLFDRVAGQLPPPRLEAMVEAALAADDTHLHQWAMEQRTGRLAPSDPLARRALAEAWLDDPAMRKAVLASEACCARLLPWLRQRLRAHALDVSEATTTMRTIGRLYGGVAPSRWDPKRAVGELEAADQRAKARAALGVWVDPPKGPPNAHDWAGVRRAALQALQDGGRGGFSVLEVVPLGPWTPEDLAVLDALERLIIEAAAAFGEARAATGEPRRRAAFAGPLLHPFEEILQHTPPPDCAARAQRVVAAWEPHVTRGERPWPDLRQLRQLAGPGHSPSARATDWMDQEDDEDLDP